MILYSQLLDDTVADMARTVGRLSHIDAGLICAVAASRAAGGQWGSLAECVALGLPEDPTFEFTYQPKRLKMTGATPWYVPRNRRIVLGERRMRYLLRFRFPRFLKHQPLETVCHELLHIHEKFDGMHSSLKHGKWFDRYTREIEREWRRKGDPSLVALMEMDFDGLRRRFGAVACRCFRKPFRTPLRLAAPAEFRGRWLEHPHARRLGLDLGRGTPKSLPLRFDDPGELELGESDFEYRVFHPRGSRRLAPQLVQTHPDWQGSIV